MRFAQLAPLSLAMATLIGCGDDEPARGAGGGGAGGSPQSTASSSGSASTTGDGGAGGPTSTSSASGGAGGTGGGAGGTGGGAGGTGGGAGGAGGGAASGDVDVDYCTPLGQVLCTRADDCACGAALPGGELDVAGCVESFRAECLETYGPVGAAVDAGDAYVDAAAAAECIALIESSTPACERPRGTVPLGLCPAWFWSFDALGDDCSFPFCEGGAGYCDDGTCAARPELGDPCNQYECAPGLLCLDDACVGPSGDGVACTDDVFCIPQLHCIHGSCGELGHAGDDCESAVTCGQGLICGEGAVCAPASGDPCSSAADCGNLAICATPRRCVVPGGLGASCEEDAACAAGFHCDTVAAACIAYPGLGEDCANGTLCAAGLACNNDFGQCVEPPGDDEPCAFGPHGPSVCAGNLGCIDGACGPLPSEGDTCTTDYRCAEGLGCSFTFDGSFCVVPAGVGTACQNDGPCTAETHCDFGTGLCAVDLATGEPCPLGNECGAADTCGIGESGAVECLPTPEAGDRCLFDCAESLACVDDRASATCVPAICLEL